MLTQVNDHEGHVVLAVVVGRALVHDLLRDFLEAEVALASEVVDHLANILF